MDFHIFCEMSKNLGKINAFGGPAGSRRRLGPFWRPLGGVLGPLGRILVPLGPSWRRLGASWKRLGALGRFGRVPRLFTRVPGGGDAEASY